MNFPVKPIDTLSLCVCGYRPGGRYAVVSREVVMPKLVDGILEFDVLPIGYGRRQLRVSFRSGLFCTLAAEAFGSDADTPDVPHNGHFSVRRQNVAGNVAGNVATFPRVDPFGHQVHKRFGVIRRPPGNRPLGTQPRCDKRLS
ncbi:unnamed protein product [Protopolystoma xenopodis]|uniref:Uncharacterized protein n=1 Tax=Protopolystoma xenopodis TaxID=117903 RepID=A0A3S5A5I1_9PLAT|nr:unnamed protein product [Protopolystoma xenopodis]